jgi:hypothetical protein
MLRALVIRVDWENLESQSETVQVKIGQKFVEIVSQWFRLPVSHQSKI